MKHINPPSARNVVASALLVLLLILAHPRLTPDPIKSILGPSSSNLQYLSHSITHPILPYEPSTSRQLQDPGRQYCSPRRPPSPSSSILSTLPLFRPPPPPECLDQNDVGAVQVRGRRQHARGGAIDAGADLRELDRQIEFELRAEIGGVRKMELKGITFFEYVYTCMIVYLYLNYIYIYTVYLNYI